MSELINFFGDCELITKKREKSKKKPKQVFFSEQARLTIFQLQILFHLELFTNGQQKRDHVGETPEMKRKRQERNEKARLKYANCSEAQKAEDIKKRKVYAAR